MWCLTGVSRAGGPFWHQCVQQALTPDFQLWDQISECDRKGPGGPVCNRCSGVCVDDSLLYRGQSTRLDGPQSSGYKFTVPFQWLWICFSLLTALVVDFLFGLHAAIYPAGLLKVHGLSGRWIMILLPVQCCRNQTHELTILAPKRNITCIKFKVFYS